MVGGIIGETSVYNKELQEKFGYVENTFHVEEQVEQPYASPRRL